MSFAVDDVKLFLDTHPYDEEALLYFDEFKKQRVQAMNRKTVLIGGGYDKNSEYTEWIQAFDGKDVYKRQLGGGAENCTGEAGDGLCGRCPDRGISEAFF